MDTVLRPYALADGPAAASFFTDAARLDDTLEPISLAQWQAFAGASFNRGAKDFVVAEQDGRIVGVLTSTRYPEEGVDVRNVRVIVHPHYRGAGIGRALLDRIDAQDAGDPLTRQTNCPRGSQSAPTTRPATTRPGRASTTPGTGAARTSCP